jgi:hypothetical protein
VRRSTLGPASAAARLLLLLAVATAAPAANAAEEAPASGPLIELIRLQVRPGQEGAMERFLAALADGARRADAPVRWRVHRRMDGERPLYVLVLRASNAEQLEAWSTLTASDTLERAYGAEEAQRLLALREAALESMQRERYEAQPSLSFDD